MNRILKAAAVLLAVCLVLFTAGCGRAKAFPEPAEIAAQLKEFASSEIKWVELNGEQISSYFAFSDEVLDDFRVFINEHEDDYDLIAVFEVDGQEHRDTVLQGIHDAVAGAANTFKLTDESEYKKISSRVLAERDDTLILCIVDNSAKASEYLTEIGATVR